MAKIFGILTALVLLASAYIAHQNNDKYAQEIETRKSEEEKLAKSRTRLKQAQTDLADTKKERGDTEAVVAKLTKDKNALEASNSALKQQIATKTDTVEKQKNQLKETEEKLAGAGNLNTLGPELKATKAKIEELTQTIAGQEGSLANLTSESNGLDKVIENYRTISQLYPAKKSNPALKTRLSAIYPNWGFVTLAAGNNSGVITNSTLEVVRDGETIAKLLVTAAEGNTASASIVPDSVKADTVLMVGDSVVAAK